MAPKAEYGEMIDHLLGTKGVGENLMHVANYDLHALRLLPDSEMQKVRGMGPRRCRQIRAAFRLLQEHLVNDATTVGYIKSPADIVRLVLPLVLDQPQEHFGIVLLDTRMRPMRTEVIYRGNIDSVGGILAHELLRPAVVYRAPHLVLFHNHPSGDSEPSPDDVKVSKLVIEAAKVLDLKVLDHVIIGSASKWCSLRERGLAFID